MSPTYTRFGWWGPAGPATGLAHEQGFEAVKPSVGVFDDGAAAVEFGVKSVSSSVCQWGVRWLGAMLASMRRGRPQLCQRLRAARTVPRIRPPPKAVVVVRAFCAPGSPRRPRHFWPACGGRRVGRWNNPASVYPGAIHSTKRFTTTRPCAGAGGAYTPHQFRAAPVKNCLTGR